MMLDYIAFTYVLYRVGLPLILSLPNPRKFEEERIRRARRHDIWFHARRGFFDCFLVGGAFLAAWQHADLGILWLVLGVALIGLAVPTSFAWESAGSRHYQKFRQLRCPGPNLIVSLRSVDGCGWFKFHYYSHGAIHGVGWPSNNRLERARAVARRSA